MTLQISKPAGNRLRVGTWNVQYGRGVEKNRLRRDQLVQRNADVWVLTETHDELALPHPFEPVSSLPRYRPDHGGRWTTIWTQMPIVKEMETTDPSRTVCVLLETREGGNVIIYGTVLPWMHDQNTDPDNPRPPWDEFHRVVDQQAEEWSSLRARYPQAALVVAGDLNHNLGGPHYYGTIKGRTRLRGALSSADLSCLTETESFPPDQLAFPPIDHVCAGPHKQIQDVAVEGWGKMTPDGVNLSDHSGVLAGFQLDSPVKTH